MSMSHEEMIAVIAASRDGKPTEWRHLPTHEWSPFQGDFWDFTNYDYRIKPTPPKPREWHLPPELLDSISALDFLCKPGDSILIREVLPEEEGA